MTQLIRLPIPVKQNESAPASSAPLLPSRNTDRDARISRALRIRINTIADEMKTCLERREEHLRWAEAYLQEYSDLDASRRQLSLALQTMRARIARGGK